jgi:hypothetical protein
LARLRLRIFTVLLVLETFPLGKFPSDRGCIGSAIFSARLRLRICTVLLVLGTFPLGKFPSDRWGQTIFNHLALQEGKSPDKVCAHEGDCPSTRSTIPHKNSKARLPTSTESQCLGYDRGRHFASQVETAPITLRQTWAKHVNFKI